MTYRAGIVGCGGMGRGHAQGYVQAGCEVVAAGADRMLDVCAQNGVALASGHPHRFDPQAVVARQWIADGGIGDPVFFWGHCGLDLMNNGTHVLDLIHFFNGDTPAEWVMGQSEV